VKLPKQITNPGLAALIQDSGFPSLERFANAVNLRGWQMHSIKLGYDHISVTRWLAGSVCQYPTWWPPCSATPGVSRYRSPSSGRSCATAGSRFPRTSTPGLPPVRWKN
jgi:hypothetical protein